MALVMLTVIGLMVGAALTYSSTSLRASNNSIRPNRASLYAADSAIQGAIEYVRDNPEMSSDVLGAACLPSFYKYNDPKVGTVTVDACPQSDSLIYEGSFRAVLLTLGQTDRRRHLPRPQRRRGRRRPRLVELQHQPQQPDPHGHERRSGLGLGQLRPAQQHRDGPGISPICNASTNPLFGGVKPKVALDPADPSLGHVADWQPAAAPASLDPAHVPRVRVEQDDAATRRLLQRQTSSPTRRTSCDDVTLSPGVYYLDFPAGDDIWSSRTT